MLRPNKHLILNSGLVLLVALAAALPVAAANGRWHLRAHAAWVYPDLDWQTSPEPGSVIKIDADDSWGLGVSGEYQVSDLLGVELGVMRATPDVRIRSEESSLGLSFSASDGLTMTPLSIGLNFHLSAKRPFDLYLGPYLAYVLYNDLEWRVNETFVVDGIPITIDETLRISVANDLAYGAVAGVDIPLGPEGWFFSGALKYLATELDATDPEGESENLSLDPFIVAIGIRYSF